MRYAGTGGVRMVRINRVYTGTGDDGTSAFVDGSRHRKSHPRFEAVGTCDELNSIVGIIRRECADLPNHADGGSSASVSRIQKIAAAALDRIQNELFDLGAELACSPKDLPEYMELISEQQCDSLTDEMDAWIENLEPLTSFILPSGTGPEPIIHHARCVTRRLERTLISIQDDAGDDAIRPETRIYVNRLSDWFFVFARWVTKNLGESETLWTPLAKRQDSMNVSTMIKKFHANEQDFESLE